jgi:hypothetical protein
MSKSVFKEVSASIGATLSATTSVVQGVATVITTVADSSVATIAPTVGIVEDLALTGRAYSTDLLAEALAENVISTSLRTFKQEAFEEAMKDEAVRTKLKAQASANLLERLFD